MVVIIYYSTSFRKCQEYQKIFTCKSPFAKLLVFSKKFYKFFVIFIKFHLEKYSELCYNDIITRYRLKKTWLTGK
ncbi:MAG TPA: hypothetical protein DCO72_10545 [Ruminococcus sp.]|nr:hypothetical protein [Ruminococcus sp.]